jgi:hypothetical protein
MVAIPTRNSVLAIKPEVTEGTPVWPASVNDFTAIQDDFDMTPEFEQLENAELKSSLAPGKTIQGAETPTVQFSHYLRHSGVEGTAPDFNELLKGGFGAEVVAGTEYTTAASSTVSLIKSTGAATNFERGEGLLIKDGTNGYRIRAVHSVSSDDITPSFNLPAGTAPGTGVGLGKAVLYKPANEGHQSMTLTHYIGNGGAIQQMAGAKTTEIGITFEAGELINASFSLEGIVYNFDPIEIGATDTKLDFEDDDGVAVATITAKTWKDPHELAAAVAAAMDTASPGETHTVTYSDTTGKFTISCTGTLLELLWNTGANAANTIGDKLGFSTAADDTGTAATTGYTSDNAVSFAAAYVPSYDAADPLAAKDNEIMMGDQADQSCFVASTCEFTLTNTNRRIASFCAVSGFSGAIINAREVVVNVTAELEKYDASRFKKFRANDNVRFQYSFGTKVGGNWVAGKCGCIYIPTATITSYDVNDDEGLASLEMELRAYADEQGRGEAYLNFL